MQDEQQTSKDVSLNHFCVAIRCSGLITVLSGTASEDADVWWRHLMGLAAMDDPVAEKKCPVEVSPTVSCLAIEMAIAPQALHLSIWTTYVSQSKCASRTCRLAGRRPYCETQLSFSISKVIADGADRYRRRELDDNRPTFLGGCYRTSGSFHPRGLKLAKTKSQMVSLYEVRVDPTIIT
jgi:hypothetical protein